LAEAIRQESSKQDELLKKRNIKTLRDEAIDAVLTGVTSYQEAYPTLISR